MTRAKPVGTTASPMMRILGLDLRGVIGVFHNPAFVAALLRKDGGSSITVCLAKLIYTECIPYP